MAAHLLKISDLSRQQCEDLLQRALESKAAFRRGELDRPLAGKTLGLLFDKPSTRTRVSFETAMVQLGGTPLFISTRDTQLSRAEPIRDTARVLSRYLDAVAIRTFAQQDIEEFAAHAAIPVINALTDLYHPCQVLSDLLTVKEIKGELQTLKIAWVGDGNNMAHSWINAAAALDLELHLACPSDYLPRADILEAARRRAGGRIQLGSDPVAAVSGADVINTDVWASMGQEQEQEARRRAFSGYQVNADLLAHAADDAVVMHCLPAHREEEISTAVLEGPQSVVWDQAENKMHLHRAVLEMLVAPGVRHSSGG